MGKIVNKIWTANALLSQMGSSICVLIVCVIYYDSGGGGLLTIAASFDADEC